uniref:Uncharacterized protein n=1 Tax=Parascaris equorum TaxID=6256 RepID=A0A914R3M5_PAREQ
MLSLLFAYICGVFPGDDLTEIGVFTYRLGKIPLVVNCVMSSPKTAMLFRWNLARKMVCESYGLVFGLSSFTALILQAILTLIVVDKRGLGMDVRSQFVIYGAYHAVIACIFLRSIIYNLSHPTAEEPITNAFHFTIFGRTVGYSSAARSVRQSDLVLVHTPRGNVG